MKKNNKHSNAEGFILSSMHRPQNIVTCVVDGTHQPSMRSLSTFHDLLHDGTKACIQV